VYICICIHECICLFIYVYLCKCVYVFRPEKVCRDIYTIYAYIRITLIYRAEFQYVSMCVYIYRHISHIHAYESYMKVSILMFSPPDILYVYTCIYACIYVCIQLYVYLHIYIYIHMYVYIILTSIYIPFTHLNIYFIYIGLNFDFLALYAL
jgi:hypothetical protein